MNSRRTRLRSALAVILTVLVLVPTAVLFGRVWTDVSDRRDQAKLERQGVEYLTALTPLVSALAEAQSTALQGVAEPPGTLAAAVNQVSAVDERIGDALKTKERWAGLKEKISKLPKSGGGPLGIFQAYVETTDLTLALHNAVRRNAELARDTDADMSNLQQAAAVDMPTAVVLVSRMGDLANLLQVATGDARTTVGAQFAQSVLATQTTVNQLTDDLQAAVSNTKDSTLSTGLVGAVDSFRRGVESMTRGANPGGTPNAATITTAQSALQTALSRLSGVTNKEMERLLDDRMDDLDYRRVEALAAGLLAVLLVLAALVLPALARRRNPEPAPATRAPVGETSRDIAASRPAAGSPYGGRQYDPFPAYGPGAPTRQERSDALR